jgi:UDP-glucose 4-epimerase
MTPMPLRRRAPHEEDEVGAFYVKDRATAIQLLQMANKLSHRVYNISNDAPLNYREFTEVVKKIVPGMQIALPRGHRPQHRPSAYMDNTRVREEAGYRPKYTIERAITEYIDWLRRHPE